MNCTVLLAPALLWAACGNGPGPSEGANGADDSSAASPVSVPLDLSAQGLPLLLAAPDKELTGGTDPEVTWKEESGRWEVVAGDHFGLTISEEPGDITRLKADLDRDALHKNTVLRDTTDLLVYRSEFPDDPDLAFIHFYQVVRAGDRTFTVQDIDGQRHNQQDVQRMLAAILPKQPA